MRHVQCGRRLCTLARALGQHARDAGQPLRLQHRVRACSHDHASHEHASTSSEDRATYTVTTPLYYVNAGEAPCSCGSCRCSSYPAGPVHTAQRAAAHCALA